MENKSSTSSRSPGDVEGEPVAKKTRLVHRTIIYDESIANQWLDEPPLEVWDHHIIPLLSLKDLAFVYIFYFTYITNISTSVTRIPYDWNRKVISRVVGRPR